MPSGSSRGNRRGRPAAAGQGGGARRGADIDRLAHWLDSRFVIPGTDIRFGLDALIGLVPGIGDSATALLGCYIVARAAALGAPKRLLLRMGWNLLVDFLVGTIPVLGDIFDVTYRANLRNAALLREHLARAERAGS
jgi:hypothetical protein